MSKKRENVISLKSVNDLCGMKFFIPSYQRGYRWNRTQVLDLLNDINEFDEKRNGFYCLQPLVVKRRNKDILNEIKSAQTVDEVETLLKGSWEVIDGQQRLTTLYIILLSLNVDDFYKLEYETRKDSASYISRIEKSKSNDNIDYYHISQAKDVVEEWLETHPEINNNKAIYAWKILEKTQFIWYESCEEDPIQVFTRLNIGKISLTNAELIKSLFLNRKNFGSTNITRQFEISCEWDQIEYTLQNDEFWLFIHKIDEERPTRIDFLFEQIADNNLLKLDERTMNRIGNDEYKTFRYFYEYFNHNGSIDCWNLVKDYYSILLEWYNDINLYHYVGFLVACKNGYDIYKSISKWQEKKSKRLFLQYLKDEILNILGYTPKNNENSQECEWPILEYQFNEDGSNKGKCKPTLLFHNIQTIINQNSLLKKNDKYQLGVFYKFPFHLYKLEGWDVEHINSNTTNPEDEPDTQREWLINIYLGLTNEEQKNEIITIVNNSDNDNDNDAVNACYKKYKEKVGITKEWDQKDKNKIWNYTLLDSSTNRSYGNAIFSGKRRVIMGKNNGVSIAIPKVSRDSKLVEGIEVALNSTFVPPCTLKVFMKGYSTVLGESNYWTKEDAIDYRRDIEMCLNKLLDK